MASHIPNVIKFGFIELKKVKKIENRVVKKKWHAKCKDCNVIITETRGTTSSFARYVYYSTTLAYLRHVLGNVGRNMPKRQISRSEFVFRCTRLRKEFTVLMNNFMRTDFAVFALTCR